VPAPLHSDSDRLRYGLAGLLFLSGIALFVFLLSRSLSAMDGGLQQMLVPGTAHLTLSSPGRQMVYYEYETVFRDTVYHRHETPPQMALRVIDTATGAEIPATNVAPEDRFTFRGRQGLSMWFFDTEERGTYEISVTMPPRMPFPKVVLSVGQKQTTGEMAVDLAGKLLPALLLFAFISGSAITIVWKGRTA